MPRAFDITPVASSLKLDGTRKGTFEFKVSNGLGKSIRVRIRVSPEKPSDPASGWFAPDPPEKDMVADETQMFRVAVTAPPNAPPGDYRFHLSVANVGNPDEEYADGPSVSFAVPQPKPQAFPWWIVVVAGAVLVVGGGVLTFLLVGHKKSVAVGTTCQADADCSADQKCTAFAPGTKACLLKPEVACAQDLECSSFWCRDQKCARDDGHCDAPTDCRPPVFACASHICLKTNGQTCGASQECQSGSCNSGTCGPQVKVCTMLCVAGSVCVNGECVKIAVEGPFRFDPGSMAGKIKIQHW